MSPGLTSYLSQLLLGPSGSLPAGPLQFRAIGGGSINTSYQLTYHERQWFCKINDAGQYPDLFVLERQGLRLLGASGIIRVPEVIDCAIIAGKQVLVMEWIEQGPQAPNFWQSFGERLAGLHHISQTAFGLDHANYMGSLPQSNNPADNWTVFFERERLRPQVQRARDNGLLDKRAVLQFEKLYTALGSIFAPEPPALLHGDVRLPEPGYRKIPRLRQTHNLSGLRPGLRPQPSLRSNTVRPSLGCLWQAFFGQLSLRCHRPTCPDRSGSIFDLPGCIPWNLTHPGKSSNDGPSAKPPVALFSVIAASIWP